MVVECRILGSHENEDKTGEVTGVREGIIPEKGKRGGLLARQCINKAPSLAEVPSAGREKRG